MKTMETQRTQRKNQREELYNLIMLYKYERLLPLKRTEEQSKNFTHTHEDEEYIMDNLDMFNRFSSKEIEQAIELYKQLLKNQ
jgi:hypothetical protein